MKVTVDAAGRLVLPKTLREAVGIDGGATVEVKLRDGHIEIEVPPAEVRLEQHGDVLVAVPAGPVPPLRTDVVHMTLDAIRAEP